MIAFGPVFTLLLSLVCQTLGQTFVVTTTSPTTPTAGNSQESDNEVAELSTAPTEDDSKAPKPEIYNLNINSDIRFRYATTLVNSKLANPAMKSQEVFFTMVLPETAFISKFLMEIKGKVYEAYVKEKEEAKKEYNEAVQSGQTAAHVAVSARDSNTFTVSVNIESQGKVSFNLTYEELLTRRLGIYEHVINLNPKQVVRDMNVDIRIRESRNITSLRVPELRSANEINPNETKSENSLAVIETPSATEAYVHFSPTPEQQKKLAKEGEENGIGGQFVVQYDVERDPQGGEVLVIDGYFVHFFAPKNLSPLRKHAIFVLDLSGSMWGRKIEQLKEAMLAILDDLKEGDYFNLIEFSNKEWVWDPDTPNESSAFPPYPGFPEVTDTEKKNDSPKKIFPVTEENIAKAKDYIQNMTAGGGTNINGAVLRALSLADQAQKQGFNITSSSEKPEPIIVFLTDGEPTVGETVPERITAAIGDANAADHVSIFSLAFGEGANYNFLKKLSLQNDGFARKIYEASDASLQLQDFYAEIASPLLANVTFHYLDDQVDWGTVTRRKFHTLFSGAECVVAGRLKDKDATDLNFTGDVSGLSVNGPIGFSIDKLTFPRIIGDYIDHIPEIPHEVPVNVIRKAGFLERLWAYLTIQQLLEDDVATVKKSEPSATDLEVTEQPTTTVEPESKTETPKEKALKLALEYSFVTPLTSLVVVKPNETTSVNAEDASSPDHGYPHLSAVPLSGFAGGPGVSNLAAMPFAPSSSGSFGGSNYGVPLYSHRPAHPLPPYATTTSDLIIGGSQSTPVPAADIAEKIDDPLTLVSLSDLEWLPNVTNGSGILLPMGDNSTDELFLLGVNETNIEFGSCFTPLNLPGHCRHLPHCALKGFADDFGYFLDHFCRINSFAGVCCPDELSHTTVAVEVESSTDQATTIQPNETTQIP